MTNVLRLRWKTENAKDIFKMPANTDFMETLRFITAGSVDDGKSTLIGRLLLDSNAVFADQLQGLRNNDGTGFNLANITDGLKAEREQGITIDVAYRYFSTDRRRFIIADAPGHVQYTKNMVTAASTADAALILIDAAQGVSEQTRRHAYLSDLLGLRSLVVCVNKMDLAGYSRLVFEDIRSTFLEFSGALQADRIEFVPISALQGDNVVERSQNMPWYEGQPLLTILENIPLPDRGNASARFPVQWVINSSKPAYDRPHFRGYAGQIYSGVFAVGDEVIVLPSGRESRIKAIHTLNGELEAAAWPSAVTLVMEDELDIGRGDVIALKDKAPAVKQNITATISWLDEEPLVQGRLYYFKHGTKTTRAKVTTLHSKIDINTLAQTEATETLRANDIGIASLILASPLPCDRYEDNRLTGSFILIDETTNATAAAGLIS